MPTLIQSVDRKLRHSSTDISAPKPQEGLGHKAPQRPPKLPVSERSGMREVTQAEMCGIQVFGFYSKAVLHNLHAPPCASHKVSDGEDKQEKKTS